MRWGALLLLAGLVVAEDDRPAIPVGDPLLQRQINAAIDRGVANLKAIQRPGGYWSGPEDERDLLKTADQSNVCGTTALCLYALAASGVPKEDPAIVRGLLFLRAHADAFEGANSCATYANALLVLALTRIDPRAYRRVIRETADRLVGGQQSDGMWTYTLGPKRTGAPARAPDRAVWRKQGSTAYLPDNSNTQFAVLALWAAQVMAGYHVPRKAWERVQKHFLNTQERDGGWSYQKVHRESTPTMTAAGAVSLVYALTSLDGKPEALARARAHRSVQRGLAHLSRCRAGGRDAGLLGNYYFTYSLERVGSVLAVDPATWYLPGARFLVQAQAADGSWGRGIGLVVPQPQRTNALEQHPYETSLALLFLTRATRRVVTTGGDDPAAGGPTTPKEAPPDISTADGLARAFELYVASNAKSRTALAKRFDRREAVGLCVAKLRDEREPVRTAAFELLSRLVDRPFLFDAAADAETRDVMLAPIEAFWKDRGDRLEWDPDRARFTVR